MIPMSEPRSERIQVLFTKAELARVDDWSFSNRVRARGEAIRRLIEAGLAATAKPPAAKPPASARSKPAGAVKGR